MRKNSVKNTRINGEVMRALADIIRGEIKDPRIGLMTSVVAVEVAPDLKTCKAWISVLGDEQTAADTLAAAMGVALPDNRYTEWTLDRPYYGVYYGYAALPMEPDHLTYLTSDLLDACTVYNYETGKTGPIYDLAKGAGKDPYELFLSGSVSLLTIENPNADTDRELVIFRDSFGSSLAPLLVPGYAKVTLADIRYLPSSQMGKYLTFTDQDVLFLYSAPVLNNSETLK